MNFTPLNRGRKQNKDTKAKNNKSDCLSTAHLGSHHSTLNTIREKNATKSKEKSKKRMSKIYYKISHCSPGFTPLHHQHHHRKKTKYKQSLENFFLFDGSTFVVILVITILIIIMITLSASLSA